MVEQSTDPPLEVVDVTKAFHQGKREIHALSHVNLTVAHGEFVAIMGTSGSGKSTLLHIAAGLTGVTSGTVRVEGQDLAKMPDRQLTLFRRHRIGLVFQSLNLVPALTAQENVLLPLHAAGVRGERTRRAEEILDRLGLADRRSHRPGALSGGEQQRVAIARALVTEPAIVLADEPTGSLDSHNSQRICAVMRELNEELHRTFVMVTHEPSVAIWADRVIILKDGSIACQLDTTDFEGPQALAARYQEIAVGVQAPELVHGN